MVQALETTSESGHDSKTERGREPARVLVIDDNEMLLGLLEAWLEQWGFEPLLAQDGEGGLRLFRDERPEVVLCDLRMPGMSGLEVLAKMHEERPETPVLIVSGSDDMRDAVQALKLGAWDYLLKPLDDIVVVEHAIRRCLERAELIRENRRYRAHLEQVNAELAESLRKLREDEAAARRVQFDLMPPPEETLGDVAFSGSVLPSAVLSGDFVDYFAIDDDRIAFYIADVSGHGVSSAFVTVMLKSFVTQSLEAYRESRSERIAHPGAFLRALNEHILERKIDKALTIFYGVIDRARGTLTYANGGHFPYPIFHDGKEARLLETRGFAIGHFDFAEFDEVILDLPPSFTLLGVSDGILSVLDSEDLEDKERALLALLDGTNAAQVTVDALMERLGLSSGERELPDDVTFLLVRRSEPS